jgi:hypothetical protein
MRRLELTQHTVRCPLEECAARVTVRTDPAAYPSRRHRDVVACSLQESASFVPPPRIGYFSDVPPPLGFVCEIERAPCHPSELACSKPCLAVLNAAEPGAAQTLRCTSGVSDAMELARQVQSPALTRTMWMHSV